MVSTIWRDIRFALRSFANQRGFTAAVAVSIALGIAANTTVFTMVNALLLGEMPVHDPSRLVSFADGRSFSWPDYVDYRDQTKSVFSGLSAHFPLVPASVGGTGEPERVWGQLADAAYFSVLGVPMQLGRGILPEEDRAGGDPVIVLSDALWRRRFAGDRGILGRNIVLNSSKYTVIGVTAAGFHGMDRGFLSEFWAPLSMADQLMPDLHAPDMRHQRNAQWLLLLARLNPGSSREKATTTVNTVKRRLEQEYRKGEKPRPAITLGKAGGLPAGGSQQAVGASAVLMVVVGLLLLIACVNVASLLLARATVRQREIGVRLAIGAGRGRLVRQLLTESIVLALLGAGLGLALAAAAVRAIAGFRLPLPIPLGLDFHIDLRVALFTAGLAVATGIAFGLAPALRATRTSLVSALKNESQGLGPGRRFGVRGILVLVQVSLSLVLLVEAGLFLRSLRNASSIDLGMRTNGVLMMAVDPKLHHYSPEKTRQFVAQIRDRVSALPGVDSVTFVDSLPLSLGGTSFGFKPRGGREEITADVYMVGERYFATLGIPLLRGRDFDLRQDTAAAMIVNEELARKMFPGEDPLAREVESDGGPGFGKQQYRVIGVARNSKSRTLGEETAPAAYLFLEPKPEQAMSFYGITVVARGPAASGPLAAAIRKEIHSLDPGLPVFNSETMQQHVDRSLLLPRLCATLLGIFGIVGAVLAAVGLYGVMSFATRARTREIGIRMALGAQPGRVLRLVTAQGLVLLGIGMAIGIGLALALTRFTTGMLYGVSATDPITFAGVPLLMALAGLVAVVVPARRAARIEPLQALHYE